jgi:hypothetical protein
MLSMAEKLTLQGKEACLSGGSGDHVILAPQFAEAVAAATLHGLTPEPAPDNTKWLARCGKLKVCIVQLTPQRRWIKWISDDSPVPFGPGATYAEYSLATPYVVLKVPFWDRHIIPRIEVFYRNRPLTKWDGKGGELFFPNLLNVSVHAYECVAWFCSQHLAAAGKAVSMQKAVDAVVHHLFGGGFNASSEMHEGLSAFGLCVREKVDERVTEVQRWAEASRHDPRFVLSVEWKTTGLTIKDLVERELKFHNLAPAPQTAAAMGNILLSTIKPK